MRDGETVCPVHGPKPGIELTVQAVVENIYPPQPQRFKRVSNLLHRLRFFVDRRVYNCVPPTAQVRLTMTANGQRAGEITEELTFHQGIAIKVECLPEAQLQSIAARREVRNAVN